MANYWQKALNAVFYANPVKLQQLIDEGHFYKQLLTDTGLLENPLPIWRIPQMWEDCIHDSNDWSEKARPDVIDFLDRVHQIKAILSKEFGIEYTPVDYAAYRSELCMYEPDDSMEEVLMVEDAKVFCNSERRLIDIELFCASEKYNYVRVKELLLQGANPSVPVPEYEMSLYTIIGADCACYFDDISSALDFVHHDPVDDDTMHRLLRVAADEMMFQLLREYDTTPMDQRVGGRYTVEE